MVALFRSTGLFGRRPWLGSGLANTLNEKLRRLACVRVLSVLATDQLLSGAGRTHSRLSTAADVRSILDILPIQGRCYGTIRHRRGRLVFRVSLVTQEATPHPAEVADLECPVGRAREK